MTGKRRGKGRPPIDDRDAVLGYMASRVNAGTSVSEASRYGLTVVGWERRQDGSWTSTMRRLGPKTLERRYRTLLSGILRIFPKKPATSEFKSRAFRRRFHQDVSSEEAARRNELAPKISLYPPIFRRPLNCLQRFAGETISDNPTRHPSGGRQPNHLAGSEGRGP